MGRGTKGGPRTPTSLRVDDGFPPKGKADESPTSDLGSPALETIRRTRPVPSLDSDIIDFKRIGRLAAIGFSMLFFSVTVVFLVLITTGDHQRHRMLLTAYGQTKDGTRGTSQQQLLNTEHSLLLLQKFAHKAEALHNYHLLPTLSLPTSKGTSAPFTLDSAERQSATDIVEVQGKNGEKLVVAQDVITFYAKNGMVLNKFVLDRELPNYISEASLQDATNTLTDDTPARLPAKDVRMGPGSSPSVEARRALMFEQRERNQDQETGDQETILDGDRVLPQALQREEKQRQIRTDQKDELSGRWAEGGPASLQRDGRLELPRAIMVEEREPNHQEETETRATRDGGERVHERVLHREARQGDRAHPQVLHREARQGGRAHEQVLHREARQGGRAHEQVLHREVRQGGRAHEQVLHREVRQGDRTRHDHPHASLQRDGPQ